MSEELTVSSMIARNARWFPDEEAVVDPGNRYTYGELNSKVLAAAHLFHEMGVRRGDRVALLLYPSANHVVLLFGAMQLGAIPVALHVRESVAVLTEVTRRLAPRSLAYDIVLADKASALSEAVPSLTGLVAARSAMSGELNTDAWPDPIVPDCLDDAADLGPAVPLRETDPALIVLSSGTTSTPKGIVHTHRTIMESARGGSYFWHPRPSDAIVNTMTTSFIGWYNLCLPYLNVGAKNVFPGRFDPDTFLETLVDEQATVAFLVPTMWRLLLSADRSMPDLSCVQLAGFAGEVMDQATLIKIQKFITPHVINIYGTTETGSCSAGTVMFEEDMRKPGKLASVGKPMLNGDLRVITPGGLPDDEVAPGEPGEVIIRGPSVASHVWDDPAATARIFRGPWWYSGDFGHLDEDGYLYLEGRTDDMIISGGINVLPARIEDVLLAHPAITEAAVVGIPDETWGQRIAAYVVTSEGVSADDLDAHVLASELSDYQRPRHYEFLSELPRTATGKMDRRSLREASRGE